MDFTFLIIVILMLLAAQSGNLPIVIALFALMLVVAKNKFLMLSAFIGLILAGISTLNLENKSIYMMGGLFLIIILLAKTDAGAPQQYGGGYY
ncbi:hypothetical protein HY989_05970 [Candidatus Micrarchaeota archaeon]|nr:hypothetical protein [Candidatus Micrarchaeota archaeon]